MRFVWLEKGCCAGNFAWTSRTVVQLHGSSGGERRRIDSGCRKKWKRLEMLFSNQEICISGFAIGQFVLLPFCLYHSSIFWFIRVSFDIILENAVNPSTIHTSYINLYNSTWLPILWPQFWSKCFFGSGQNALTYLTSTKTHCVTRLRASTQRCACCVLKLLRSECPARVPSKFQRSVK